MAKTTGDIKAGGAFIELYVNGAAKVNATLQGVGSTYKRFSSSVAACARVAQRTVTACNRVIAASAAATRQALSGAANVGQSINAAGRTAMISGGAGVAAMGYSASTYMGFEKEMSKVRALSQASAGEYQELVALAKELGATTEYTAQNAAEGMAFLGMTGYKTNQILAATPVLLDAATAAGMDLGRTADIMSDVAQAFGISADDITRVADVLSITAMNANTNVEMMGTSFQYVAASATFAGQPIEEVAAALGILANSGLKASKAGTGLRAMLAVVGSRLGKKKLFREFGISAWDAQGDIKPLLTIIQELDTAMAGLSSGERTARLNAVFGKIAGTAVGTLVNNASSVDKYRDITNNQRDGATAKMAATMRNNLWGSWKGLVSAIEAVQIAIGEVLSGELRGYLDRVTEIARATAKWVGENKQMVVTAAKITAAVAGIGIGVVAVGTLLGGVGAIVVPLITAVTSFGMIGVGIFGAMATAVASVLGIIGTLIGGFVSVGVAAGGALLSLGPIGVAIAAIVGVVVALKAAVLVLSGTVTRAFYGITGSISGCFRGLSESVWEAVGSVGRGFMTIFADAKRLVVDLGQTFSGIWDALKIGDMRLAMDILWTEIELRFELGKEYMKEVWQDILKTVRIFTAEMKIIFFQMFQDILDGLAGLVGAMSSLPGTKLAAKYAIKVTGAQGLAEAGLQSAELDKQRFEKDISNPSKTKPETNKRIADLKARREALLKTAASKAKEADDWKKGVAELKNSGLLDSSGWDANGGQLLSLINGVRSNSLSSSLQTESGLRVPMLMVRDQKQTKHEAKMAELRSLRERTEFLSGSSWGRDLLWADLKQKKFSELAQEIGLPTDLLKMQSGGGTFSGFEMGSLGGNTFEKKLDDQLALLKEGNAIQQRILDEAEGGGYGG